VAGLSTVRSGVERPVLLLRALLVVLPCAALALALPEVPHWLVVGLVVACSVTWGAWPDHPAGAVALVSVAAWWAVHDVLDWRVPVVAVLLLGAHVVATLLSYGPATLALDPHLARLWLGRGLLALVPLPVTYAAARGLDPDLAPAWTWTVAGVLVAALLVATARLTRAEEE
jgi:hypothetical protein